MDYFDELADGTPYCKEIRGLVSASIQFERLSIVSKQPQVVIQSRAAPQRRTGEEPFFALFDNIEQNAEGRRAGFEHNRLLRSQLAD